MLAAYLLERSPCFDDVDLILPVPGVIGPGRPVDHTREVLAAATPRLERLWPIDSGCPPVVVKTAATRSMVDAGSAGVRRLWAAGELRAALAVTDARRVRGRRVLVLDDVFTDGSTLREVAGALRGAGATAVSGIVLARAPLLVP
jgi:hypothetical protein